MSESGGVRTVRAGGLCRVTLVGERRRADVVLPADEPVGLLLPEVVRLLGDPEGRGPVVRRLVTARGDVLPQDATLGAAEIPDGAVLRLFREGEAPPAPVVHDVTDEASEDVDLRHWRWRPWSRRWVAGVAAVVLALVAGGFARAGWGAETAGRGLCGAALLAVLCGALLGRATRTAGDSATTDGRDGGVGVVGGTAAAGQGATDVADRGVGRSLEDGEAAVVGQRALAAVLLVVGGALGGLGGWMVADTEQWAWEGRLTLLSLVVGATLALLGRFSPVGRGGLVGAAAVVGMAGLWLLSGVLVGEGREARAAVVVAVVSAVLLGVLPRWALAGAGLTSLDDRRSAGASVSRHAVRTALAATHRGLVLATLATAVSAGVAGWVAVGEPTVWTVLLVAVLTLVLFSRARAYPLVAEVVALQAAGTVLMLRLVALWMERARDGAAEVVWPVLAACALALLPLGVLAARPPEHVRVRLGRALNGVESLGVVALLPLAVGAFGAYGRLLDTF
ncbi:type VII secretion integral membrane protein EccD [Streptomyces sp. AJS327]|uniref:EsaB/YukD family protein n=1 Tax=Streptomyces sp. AJS327 TaxID=2545265 RepID=UPI0015DFB7BC|nr:EsaB/YukD family protein [Streptomyces sp. AJS327]MBA0053983.1 type VII secretion integral membrane protein EccD [Streptomyces sp. AJS327]